MPPLSRTFALALAAALLAAVPAGAELCAKRRGIVVSREKCKKRRKERPLVLDVSVAPGEPGDPGPTGPPGALRVLDANGVLVGHLIPTLEGPTFFVSVALVTTPAGPLVMGVSPLGFPEAHRPPELHYENKTCTGTAYIEVGEISFHNPALVVSDEAYYPQGPTAVRTFASEKQVGEACSVDNDTLRSAQVGTFPISSLGFTPPFSLSFP